MLHNHCRVGAENVGREGGAARDRQPSPRSKLPPRRLVRLSLEVEELRAALDNDKTSPILHLQLANLLFPVVRG